MLRSEGEDEDELEDDDVSCPESDARSIDSERGGVELDSARIPETGAGPSAGTTCWGAGAVVAGGGAVDAATADVVKRSASGGPVGKTVAVDSCVVDTAAAVGWFAVGCSVDRGVVVDSIAVGCEIDGAVAVDSVAVG